MKVGILGGGQLGRMLALSGYPLGLTFRFLDPNPQSPAGQIGELIVGDYDDTAALRRFAQGIDVATYEFESVPVAAVNAVGAVVPALPPARALASAQDRLVEREMFERLGVSVAPYASVASESDLPSAAERVGFPALLKTRTLGYDGKGQLRVERAADLQSAWRSLGGRPCILEYVIGFRRELSVLTARAADGAMLFYPLIENDHREGILRTSVAPANAPAVMQAEAESLARRVAEELEYVGLFAIELFDTDSGLIANEMAPRVHNSGHWTIEGAETSQFENHLRAVLGLPLGSTAPLGASAMVNLIGHVPDLASLLAIPYAHVHLYGKSALHRRKLGHVTVCAPDRETVAVNVAKVIALAR